MAEQLLVDPKPFEPIEKRWAPAVLVALAGGRLRFNRVLEGIPGISDRLLTERLRELKDVGLVERHVHAGPPIRVEYQLTERGSRVAAVLTYTATILAEPPAEGRV